MTDELDESEDRQQTSKDDTEDRDLASLDDTEDRDRASTDESGDRHWTSRWALPAAFVLHVLPVALLLLTLPLSLPQPAKEKAINVSLVPPPGKKNEASKPKPPAPQEAKKAEDKKQPEKKPPEKKQVEKKQAENPPPPSPQTKQDAKPSSPLAVMRPVVQFGQKDTGPRRSLAGNSPTEPAPTPDVPDQSAKPDTPDKAPAKSATTATLLTAKPIVPQPRPQQAPAPKPEAKNKPPTDLKLHQAKTLFSPAATGEVAATTAMRGLPRDVRAGELCLTELRAQLLNDTPPYFPDILPSYRLKSGTMLEIPQAAFRAGGQWFNLSYRCEINADATKVVSFALRVGVPIPRSEWQSRGLPSQ